MKEREQILEMLSKGTITVQEAKELLDALDYEEPVSKKKNVLSFDADKAKEGLSDLEKSIGGFFKNTFSGWFDRDYSFQIKGNFDLFQKLYKIDVSEMEEPKLFIYNQNGIVKLKETDEEELSLNITVHYKDMNIFDDSHFFTLTNKDGNMTFRSMKPNENEQFYLEVLAKIPKKEFSKILVDTSNAPIEAMNLTVSELDFSTSNGKILLQDTTAKELFLTTSNGSVRLEHVQGDNAQVGSSNGKIWMEDIQYTNFNGRTSNGKINGESMDLETLGLSTSNGAIILDKLSTENLKKADLVSTNGDLSVEVTNLMREAHFDLATSTGKINLNVPIDIRANTQKEGFSKNKHIRATTSHYVEGEDAIEFVLSTTNANISIENKE